MTATVHPTILIVDDETNIRLMLRSTLESVGYTVIEAVNGRQGLEMIDRQMPDLVILDLSMPLLDGIGVLKEVKDLRPQRRPRMIVLTAYGSIAAAVKATRLGAMDFLEKPVSPQEVRESIEAVLAEPLPQALGEGDDPLSGGYAGVLERVRKALRLANYADAETLLMKAADLAHKDAAYFNLIGVIYESQRQWRLARKFYNKAISADKRYEPAQQNLRRVHELQTLGSAHQAVCLGDEPDLMFARLPNSAD